MTENAENAHCLLITLFLFFPLGCYFLQHKYARQAADMDNVNLFFQDIDLEALRIVNMCYERAKEVAVHDEMKYFIRSKR